MADNKPSQLLQSMMTRAGIDNPTATQNSKPTDLNTPSASQPSPATKSSTENLNAWHIPLSEKANPTPEQQSSGKQRPSNAWATQGAPKPAAMPASNDTKVESDVKKSIDEEISDKTKASKEAISKRVASLNKIGKLFSSRASILGISKDPNYLGAKSIYDNFTKTLESKGPEALANASPDQVALLDRIQGEVSKFARNDGKDYPGFVSKMEKLIGATKQVQGNGKTSDFLGSLTQTLSSGSKPQEASKGILGLISDKLFGDIKKIKSTKDLFEENSILGKYFKGKEDVANAGKLREANIVEGGIDQESKNLQKASQDTSAKQKKERSYGEKYKINSEAEEKYFGEKDSDSSHKDEPRYKLNPDAGSSVSEAVKTEANHYEKATKDKEKVKPGEKLSSIGSLKVDKLEVKSLSGDFSKMLGGAAAGAAAEESGGLSLSDIPTGKFGKFAKLGKFANVAKGGLAAVAGGLVDYGGDKLKEAGHEDLGTAANIGGKALEYGGTGAMIGSVVPGVGTAIGAGVGGLIGAGVGVYQNFDKVKEWGGKAKDFITGSSPTMLNQSPEQIGQMNEAQAKESSKPVIIQAPAAPQQAPAPQNNATTVPVRASLRNNESSFQDWARHKMQGW